MEEKSWREFIPIYLKDYCSQFNSYYGNKIHTLIVEGPTDEKFYCDLFGKSCFRKNGHNIIFNTTRKNIISNFSDNFQNLSLRSEPYKNRDYQKELKRHKEEFAASNKSGYRGYLFVTECISYYQNHKDQFKKLDCYGMIDNDFGHSELIDGLLNIAPTKFHDRETSIMRCYLPDFCHTLKDKKENFVEFLSDIVDVAFKQGIIEKMSHDYEKIYGEDKFLKKLTNYFFSDNSTILDLRNLQFDFINYLDNYENYLHLNLRSNVLKQHKLKYKKFISDCKDRINSVYTFNNELKNILHRWLIDKNINDCDSNIIDLIFIYCNGHILLNQLCFLNNGIFPATNEIEFIDNIKNDIILKNTNYIKLFETLPLKPYKKHREDYGFYSRI